jgi:mono/diheme cytochrome c family protein
MAKVKEAVWGTIIIVLLALALSACSTGQDQTVTVPPSPYPTVEEEHREEMEDEEHAKDESAEEGLAIFRNVGCAGCHGQNGEGGVGPALPGHTAEQVERQVRTPKGDVMPAYTEEQLSDAQMNQIIAWVESLGPATGAHMHGEEEHAEEFEATAPLAAHLRLAVFAVKDGNTHDAEHHIEDLVAQLEDEHTKEQAQKILSSLVAGDDLHDVEHEMEHLLGEIAPDTGDTDLPAFHLQLALDSLTLEDVEAADHHLEHYIELVDDADLAAEAGELREHLEEGELHTVEDGVQALLAGEVPNHQD